MNFHLSSSQQSIFRLLDSFNLKFVVRVILKYGKIRLKASRQCCLQQLGVKQVIELRFHKWLWGENCR